MLKQKFIFIVLLWSAILFFSGCDRKSNFSKLKGNYLGQKPPGLIPEIFAPGFISTEKYSELGCTFTPDGKEIYFTRNKGGLTQPTIFASRFEKDGWRAPEPVAFSGYGPHVTYDGRRMLITKIGETQGNEICIDIWILNRTAEGWENPEYHGPGARATASSNGNIYFIDRSLKDDRGVIAMQKFAGGKYTRPEVIGGGVNTPYYEAHPCIAPDESYIIFDSDRLGGHGSGDLYICFRNEDGSWGEAINLGVNINTAGYDGYASISPDGRYLFYSTREGGSYDIYWVNANVIEELKP